MEEKRAKVAFSIIHEKPKPPKPTARPAAFSAGAGPQPAPAPAPLFVNTFDPSQTLTAPAAVIAPLPNSRRPSAAPTGGGPAFVLDTSENSPSSSGAVYGLAVRDTEESNKRNLAAPDDVAAAATRRFKQDMAVLPDDTQGGADEVPVEGFGAALLAGYGWKEGNPIGRDKSKGDPKVVQPGRGSGTQGLGAGPSDKKDSTVRPTVRRSVRDLRVACLRTD